VSQSWKGEGGTPTGAAHPGWIFEARKGKLAVCKDEAPDPYMVARDIHVLLSRVNDLSRFFNSRHSSPRKPRAGRSVRVAANHQLCQCHALLGQPGDSGFHSSTARRDVDPGFGGPGGTQLEPENTGMDVQIPSISAYAAGSLALRNWPDGGSRARQQFAPCVIGYTESSCPKPPSWNLKPLGSVICVG